LGDPICSTRSTGRADHGLQRTLFQAQLDPVAHLACQRAVVQRDQPGPIRARIENRLIPELRLRAGVGEHQRGGGRFDLLDHLRQHAQAQVPGPGKAFEAGRQQGVDLERFVDAPLDQPPLPGVQ